MPNELNKNGRFEPIHDAHAIEQLVLVVQINPPLSDSRMADASRMTSERFGTELPGQADIQGFALSFGGPGPMGPISSGPALGRVFQRIRPDGNPETELRVERGAITFRTAAYTRWQTLWAQVSRYLDALLPKYLEGSGISGLSLNFVDKFFWVGDVTACRASLLLRRGSDYFCPHVLESADLWHCHTGAFVRVRDTTKRLLNVNLDCLDENRPEGIRRVVVITTGLTDLMNQPGYVQHVVEPKLAPGFVREQMFELHDRSKEIFGNVVNDDICKRIALKD